MSEGGVKLLYKGAFANSVRPLVPMKKSIIIFGTALYFIKRPIIFKNIC